MKRQGFSAIMASMRKRLPRIPKGKGLKSFQWLEIAEIIAILGVLIGCGIAIATNQLLSAIIPVPIALLFNWINRLRLEKRNKRGVAKALKHLHGQVSQEMLDIVKTMHSDTPKSEIVEGKAKLEKPKALVTPSTPPPMQYTTAIAFVQEEIASLEQSVSRVVQYLNSSSLPGRVEELEKITADLSEELTQLSNHLAKEWEKSLTALQQQSSISQPYPICRNLPKEPLIPQPPELPLGTWNLRQTLTSHTNTIPSVAIDPNGKWVASVSWDTTLKLWELNTGRLIKTKEGHSQALLCVTFVGSDRLATGSFDQTVKLWQIEESETRDDRIIVTETLTGHLGSVRSLAATPDGQRLASGSYDHTIKLWNLSEGEVQHSFYDPTGYVEAIALTPDGQYLANAGGDGCISLWNVNQQLFASVLTGNVSSVESLTISPNGELLAVGCVDGSIRLWRLNASAFDANLQHSPAAILQGHLGQVMSLVFCDQGQRLISGSIDGTIRIWDLSSGEQVAILRKAESDTPLVGVTSLALSPDGQFLVAGRVDGKLNIWQKETSV
ncbi:MAG: WD40 repeat domain-containing protein [Chroococcales cyanobacterium]